MAEPWIAAAVEEMKMTTAEVREQSRIARVGWGILLAMSALLILHGATWFFAGPETALVNIAERTSLAPQEFQQGNPSAFDIITLINRNYSVFEVALGLMALLVGWQGYRYRSRWAWAAMWVLVAAFALLAANFIVPGGASTPGLSYLGVAVVALVGQLLAGKDLAARTS